MIVDEKTSKSSVFIMARISQISIQMPEMNANLDKNKSQRISDFSVK